MLQKKKLAINVLQLQMNDSSINYMVIIAGSVRVVPRRVSILCYIHFFCVSIDASYGCAESTL